MPLDILRASFSVNNRNKRYLHMPDIPGHCNSFDGSFALEPRPYLTKN